MTLDRRVSLLCLVAWLGAPALGCSSEDQTAADAPGVGGAAGAGGTPGDAGGSAGAMADAAPDAPGDAADAGPWVDPTLSNDPDARAKSAAYEAQIWPYRDDLRYQIEAQFGELRLSDAEARALTYSSGWGLATYHTMDEIIALSQLMEATDDESHRLYYADIARDALNIVVPAIVEGKGTEGCPAKAGSLYQCSQGYFRYLDAAHGTGAAGFVMNAFYENPTLHSMYASDLEAWATALKPTLERHYAITESTDASPYPHMPAKIAAGHLAIGKILGDSRYTDAFERVVKVLAASCETNSPKGWVGSDVSHARVSAAVMHLAYREQLRGTFPPILTPAHLAGVGDAFEAARNQIGNAGGFNGSLVGHHGTFVRFSSGIAGLVDDTYVLPKSELGKHAWSRPAETIAALCIGHVTPLSGP